MNILTHKPAMWMFRTKSSDFILTLPNITVFNDSMSRRFVVAVDCPWTVTSITTRTSCRPVHSGYAREAPLHISVIGSPPWRGSNSERRSYYERVSDKFVLECQVCRSLWHVTVCGISTGCGPGSGEAVRLRHDCEPAGVLTRSNDDQDRRPRGTRRQHRTATGCERHRDTVELDVNLAIAAQNADIASRPRRPKSVRFLLPRHRGSDDIV